MFSHHDALQDWTKTRFSVGTTPTARVRVLQFFMIGKSRIAALELDPEAASRVNARLPSLGRA